MAKKEYILSDDWCPATYNEITLISSLQKDYGTPEFMYVFHPPQLEKFDNQAVLYGKVPPNIHIFLSIKNITTHAPFQKFMQASTLKHVRVKAESLDCFVTKPLEVIKELQTHTCPY